MRAIARGLSPAHDVVLVHGGRPVPGGEGPGEPEAVMLPALFRAAGRLSAAGGPAGVPAALRERARILARAVERFRPDVVLIEHYPFSKWELEPEFRALIDAARATHPHVRIECSLREIVKKTRYEDAATDVYEARVLEHLRASFDAILVHGDPAFTTIDRHFRRAGDLPVPVHYTGFVVETVDGTSLPEGVGPYAVLSCGGAGGNTGFLLAAIEAFERLRSAGALGDMRLVVFPGPALDAAETEALEQAARGGHVEVRAFSPAFAGWLEGSALSISRAGYNTCTQVLRSRRPNVLVPDPTMSDQEPRAARLADLALTTAVFDRPPGAHAIVRAIERALAHPPAPCDLDLGGVAGTRAIIEKLGATGRA